MSATNLETTTSRIVDRAARVVTELLAPAVLAATMPLVMAMHATSPSWGVGLGWAFLAVLFTAAVPYSIIRVGVRRGTLTDHHIGIRQQRRTPLLLGLLSCLVGLIALAVLGAPRPLIAMVIVLFVVGVVITGINQMWKLSAHAAVAASSATTLVIVFGIWMLLLVPVVAAICWSRVRLGDHTLTQVIAGAVAGAVLAPPTYLLIT